ncbi:MAG: amidohydrolase [Vicinamibacteria bacterium]|nr:amidohydrolase [Vicinamibacteria bacterium]
MLSLILGAAMSLQTADTIFVNGRVYVQKGRFESALAVAGDRVLAVGNDAAIRALASKDTRVVDLKGRLVTPGFNDAHVHFLDGGFGLLSVDLRDAKDEAEFAERIGRHAAGLPKGAWILNGNWDHERWKSQALPTKALIDAVTSDNPVAVNRLDGHMILANSPALKAAGIDRNTKDPFGGTIVRDASGEPTGILKDNAQDLLYKALPEPTREMNVRAAKAALAHAASLGVTSVQDNSSIDALPTYQQIRAEGGLLARINVWRPVSAMKSLIDAGVRSGLGDEWIRIGAIKILSDGSMGAGTAAFFDPYTDEPATSGLLLYPVEELNRMIDEADAADFQLAVHAIGDRANALVLDAFEKAAAARPRADRRFRIEHAQVVRRADLPRYAKLRVVASIQPSHCIDDMRWAPKRIGVERCRMAYNFKSFLDAGIPVAFGTDWYVEPLDPRLGLYAAVTRETVEGGPKDGFLPEERIPLEAAIDLYTRGSAYAEFADDRKGTLEPGKLADLAIFAEDLFKLEPKKILTTPVDLTMVGGRVVFERMPPHTP